MAGQAGEQGRLACAVGANERHALARIDLQAHAIDRANTGEVAHQIAHLQQHLAHDGLHRRSPATSRAQAGPKADNRPEGESNITIMMTTPKTPRQ